MRTLFKSLLLAGGVLLSASAMAAPAKPTVILAHGAFADASSWNGVVAQLTHDGYPVIAAANPLRGAASDAAYIASIVSSVKGPVVLVGHSYGGTVISEAAADTPNVKALVFVAAFAPDLGESSFELAGKIPGSTLGAALAPPVELPGGGDDLSIVQSKFPAQFAADVPLPEARLMAVAQRPLAKAAGEEKVNRAAWRAIPSWFIYGTGDLNIPPAALQFMAERADARKIVVVPGASHVVMVSHPHEVATLIESAAAAPEL